jgi:hypothetical protein
MGAPRPPGLPRAPLAFSISRSNSPALGEPLFGADIKLGRARAFVRRHFLGVLEHAAIGECVLGRA